LENSDRDVKKYAPRKSLSKKTNQYTNSIDDGGALSIELSENNKELRRKQENYLFRGYGNMLDTSEIIDFSEGADSY